MCMNFEWDEAKRQANMKNTVSISRMPHIFWLMPHLSWKIVGVITEKGVVLPLERETVSCLLWLSPSVKARFASSLPAAPIPEKGESMNRKQHKPPTRMTLRELQAAESQTDWQHLQTMTDEEITRAAESDPDNLPLDDAFWESASRLSPSTLLKEAKQQITLRIDADVLEWFRSCGSGYQSRMNAVLKAYVQTHGGQNAPL